MQRNIINEKQILITGFMGAGKLTLLQKLQESHSFEGHYFCVLDDEIEKSEGKTPFELLSKMGCENLRKFERAKLIQLLREREKIVISLDEGTLSEEFLEELRKEFKPAVLHADLPFNELWSRIGGDWKRPLIAAGRKQSEQLFIARRGLYQKSDYRIGQFDKGEKDLLKKIILWDDYREGSRV